MPTLTLLLIAPALFATAWVAHRFLLRRKGARTPGAILIRPQRAGEVRALADLIETAFRTARVSDGHEQDFFRDTLMAEDRFLPGLSLVAERAGEPVGHVMLTRLWAEGLLLLAPLSVRADLRGHGVGARLMRAVLRKAQAEGWRGVVLVGDPGYYVRFGFRPMESLGLTPEPPFPAPYPQTLELFPGALAHLHGGRVRLL